MCLRRYEGVQGNALLRNRILAALMTTFAASCSSLSCHGQNIVELVTKTNLLPHRQGGITALPIVPALLLAVLCRRFTLPC